ncbi:MAG: hypothetical protein NC131_00890 [Roseburia sp.]|nr:hypothetical protein [Roseburia sp.]
MKIKLQCRECKKAKKSEPLYFIDDEIYCVYCGMALMTERVSANVEFAGYAGEIREKQND